MLNPDLMWESNIGSLSPKAIMLNVYSKRIHYSSNFKITEGNPLRIQFLGH